MNFAGTLFLTVNDPIKIRENISSELCEILSGGDNQPAIMWKFFVAAFEKYTPKYWEFVKNQWQRRPENRAKNIEDYFDK